MYGQGDGVMDKQTQEIVNRFQDSLSTLRKVAGWSAEHLGEIIDVTRQTIVNLESGQTKMTKVQYMAIRMAFEREIKESKNETLAKLMLILVDSDGLDEKNRVQVKKTVDSATNSTGGRAGAATASKAAIAALGPLLAGAAFTSLLPVSILGSVVASGATMAGLFNILKKDPNK